MPNDTLHLSAQIFTESIERKPTRDGFGTGIVEAGADPRVVVLCADLKESTRAEAFEKAFPDRYLELGVAEQNMAVVGAGLALGGKIPYITSYAAFSPGRNYEQIRTTFALNEIHAVVCGMHAGVSVGPDGATHQMLEDIGLMRMLPRMTVLAPGDAVEAHKAVVAAASLPGPVYIRFGRSATPVFTTPETPFVVGKALPVFIHPTPRVGIVSTGSLTYEALCAAHELADQGVSVSVLHMPSIKPLDEAALIELAEQVRGIVTVEEHQAMGGFGSAVAECLSQHHPTRITRLGIQDVFGQSGTPDELIAHYGVDRAAIVRATLSLS
jgi:transketolase